MFLTACDINLLVEEFAIAVKPVLIIIREGFEGDDAFFIFHDAGGFDLGIKFLFQVGGGFQWKGHHFDLGFGFEELTVFAQECVGTFLIVFEGSEILIVLHGPVDMFGVRVAEGELVDDRGWDIYSGVGLGTNGSKGQ